MSLLVNQLNAWRLQNAWSRGKMQQKELQLVKKGPRNNEKTKDSTHTVTARKKDTNSSLFQFLFPALL